MRLLISARQQTVISLLLGAILFGLFGTGALLFAWQEISQEMARQSQSILQPYAERARQAAETFEVLKADVTAPPCTPEFDRQIRGVAYRPDGLNEFFYAPDGIIECTVSMGRLNPPITLGQPDIPARDGEPAIWIDRGLAFAGLKGFVGSVLHIDPFAVVLPVETVHMNPPGWMGLEVVFVAPSGRWWHRAGEQGVFARNQSSQRQSAGIGSPLRQTVCLPNTSVCVATEAPLAALLSHGQVYVVATLVTALALAAWLARMARAMIVRRWSFESRFRRHLDAGSVICAYQPIMDLRSGEIAGCEVLARWRDVDDSVVYPDRFIPLVEKFGLTRKFTRMVVEKACSELSGVLPLDRKISVTFNIFPCDFDAAFLCDAFKPFEGTADRFQIVVEIVENDAIEVADAQIQIEALRAAGIKTYIDDFGTGYSNIHNLAALSVDGVKLDRSFAMAAEGSVMSRMLGFAVDMIHASGWPIIVEGVETAERLRQLRAMPSAIDFVQGYHISRPLDVEAFCAFRQRHAKGFQRLERVA
ncbi:EAL domain-containing protein [Aureimonas sp. SA4125]|uniref:EAL domain-containing protein n=1 Tax=Aureimonas sp. SA4125 TaxID=2826993 RepID=UPI001CC5E03F|nr:EAL domain-containing protein [Aureimonas sp. SA4125]